MATIAQQIRDLRKERENQVKTRGARKFIDRKLVPLVVKQLKIEMRRKAS